MWHLLLAVAVAGTTCFATNHFFSPRNTVQNANADDPNDHDSSESQNGSPSQSKQRKGHRLRKLFCWRKRKNHSNVAPAIAKAPICSPEGNSLFGLGLSFGIMFMMSARKDEINKLNKTVEETAKVVQELKCKLNRRKSSCAREILDSDGNTDLDSRKMHEVMLKKTNSEPRDSGAKIWSPVVNDNTECGSSAVTEEPEPGIQAMDQLEAELEFELQKLSGVTIDSVCHKEIKPELEKLEAPDEDSDGTDDWDLNYSQSHGVPALELHQRLSELLIKQQEEQITELESELRQAQSKLHEKEAELQALKDCVKCLTELSLSAISDDETQTLISDCDNNNVESKSNQSVLGAKRPLDSESGSRYM